MNITFDPANISSREEMEAFSTFEGALREFKEVADLACRLDECLDRLEEEGIMNIDGIARVNRDGSYVSYAGTLDFDTDTGDLRKLDVRKYRSSSEDFLCSCDSTSFYYDNSDLQELFRMTRYAFIDEDFSDMEENGIAHNKSFLCLIDKLFGTMTVNTE